MTTEQMTRSVDLGIRTQKCRVFEDGLGVVRGLHCLGKSTFLGGLLLGSVLLRGGRGGGSRPTTPRRRSGGVHEESVVAVLARVVCAGGVQEGVGRRGGGLGWGGFVLAFGTRAGPCL